MKRQHDRMSLLAPLITAKAVALARQRVIDDKRRITTASVDLATKRIALLLVRELNPWAHLTNEEEGILRGLNADTIGTMKSRGEL